MKTIFASLFFTVLFICCESKEKKTVPVSDLPGKKKENPTTSNHCYLFANERDTIKLSYLQKGNKIEGWMNYDFYEKDGSIGEVEGEISGDTLKLEYDFLSEGMISEQQVYFLKKGNYKLYRGSGEMRMTDDSVMVYSRPGEINFSDNMPLGELKNCPVNFINSAYQKFYIEEKEKQD